MVKNSSANAGDGNSTPGSGKFPWRREWQPTPVFLLGKFCGQRSLVGCKSMWSQRVGHNRAAGIISLSCPVLPERGGPCGGKQPGVLWASVFIKGGLIRTVSEVLSRCMFLGFVKYLSSRMVLVAFFFLSVYLWKVVPSWLGFWFSWLSTSNSHCVFHCHGQMNVTTERRHETQFAY